jgi:hypothetical protein
MIATYPNLPLGVTEAEEYDMLRQYTPWLFDGVAGRSLLYVGANQLRPPFHAQRLKQHGWSLHLYEVFKGNIDHHANTGLFNSLTLGDIRTIDLQRKVDCVFWWHGCEHIPEEDLPETLRRLELLAPNVVLGCPDGYSPQATVYGNEAEQHQWSVEAGDLRGLGYQVVGYAPVGRKHLLAWKTQ